MEKNENGIACALSAAGSDSGAGAGIQADLLTFAANGVHGCTAIAALTAQNPSEVRAISVPKASFFKLQLDTVYDFFKPSAAKTGMLFNSACVNAATDFFECYRDIRLVVDPVMISTSHSPLLKKSAMRAMGERLIPLAEVFTPNLDEAAYLLNFDCPDDCERDLRGAALKLRDKFSTSVLLKGGHAHGSEVLDLLVTVDGKIQTFGGQRIEGINTHGSGCTLSAAIAANLAKGKSLTESCSLAKEFILESMKKSIEVRGETFINRLYKL